MSNCLLLYIARSHTALLRRQHSTANVKKNLWCISSATQHSVSTAWQRWVGTTPKYSRSYQNHTGKEQPSSKKISPLKGAISPVKTVTPSYINTLSDCRQLE